MSNLPDPKDVLRDIMTRPNANFKQKADMGSATGISFAMENHGARRVSNGDPNSFDSSVTHRDPEPTWDPND